MRLRRCCRKEDEAGAEHSHPWLVTESGRMKKHSLAHSSPVTDDVKDVISNLTSEPSRFSRRPGRQIKLLRTAVKSSESSDCRIAHILQICQVCRCLILILIRSGRVPFRDGTRRVGHTQRYLSTVPQILAVGTMRPSYSQGEALFLSSSLSRLLLFSSRVSHLTCRPPADNIAQTRQWQQPGVLPDPSFIFARTSLRLTPLRL